MKLKSRVKFGERESVISNDRKFGIGRIRNIEKTNGNGCFDIEFPDVRIKFKKSLITAKFDGDNTNADALKIVHKYISVNDAILAIEILFTLAGEGDSTIHLHVDEEYALLRRDDFVTIVKRTDK